MMGDIDVGNRQLVGATVSGDHILVSAPKTLMSRDEALVHAAWIVALADRDGRFDEVLAAVRST